MKLKMSVNGEKAVVYREKWGTIAFITLLGGGCLIFPILFYWQSSSSQPGSLQGVFALLYGLFALAGLAILIRLPRYIGQLLNDNGAHMIVADASGISLTAILGIGSQHWPWNSITEVTLAERLGIIDHDEAAFRNHSLVCFLPATQYESLGWLNRLKFGVAKSGKGRTYLTCRYPPDKGLEFESALRQFAPDSVSIKLHRKVVFNCQTCVDIYSEILPAA